MFMFFICLPRWTQNPYFMSRPCLSFQFQAPWGQGLCLPLNEVHIASRSPWGPAQNWHQAQGTCRGAEAHTSLRGGWRDGQAASLCTIQALQIAQITLSRSHVFAGGREV